MNALDVRILVLRAAIRREIEAGHDDEIGELAAELRGLLFGQSVFSPDAVESCAHRVHKIGGLDTHGKAIWRCTDCGERA